LLGADKMVAKFLATSKIIHVLACLRFARRSKSGFPMRASESFVGGAAHKCHTPRWDAVMVSANGSTQSVSLALCDAPIAAEGGLSP